jgi:uncharacterized protein YutE (UPF0331/DUF86 family)
MSNDPTKTIESEAVALIQKHLDEFSRRVAAETDTTTILLKGHLLIEYYMDHLILLLFDKAVHLSGLGFYQKTQKLKEKNCLTGDVMQCLKTLNDLRNNLAHRLDFKISFSEIDSIGFNLGRTYVMDKFSSRGKTEKDLLLSVINQIASSVFFPIFNEVLTEKKKELEQAAPSTS